MFINVYCWLEQKQKARFLYYCSFCDRILLSNRNTGLFSIKGMHKSANVLFCNCFINLNVNVVCWNLQQYICFSWKQVEIIYVSQQEINIDTWILSHNNIFSLYFFIKCVSPTFFTIGICWLFPKDFNTNYVSIFSKLSMISPSLTRFTKFGWNIKTYYGPMSLFWNYLISTQLSLY